MKFIAVDRLRAFVGVLMLAIAVAGTGPASAADSSSLNVLGYSPDGKVFAFEEYGIQDGSGFPYSSIFFLDIDKDEFVAGTPIRVRLDDETASLAAVRAQAKAKADPLVAKFKLGAHPGVMVAYNPTSEADSNPHRLRYHSFLQSPPSDQPSTLELTEKEFPPVNDCLNMTGNFTGFSLKLTEHGGKHVDRLVHEDKQIPKSRTCPNGYRIGAVIAPVTLDAPQIAMIVVSSFGFEGNNQRWIAVPIRFDGP